MTMNAGNADCTTGLSKRIYDARVAAAGVIGIADDRDPLKADCYAIAVAIVDEITANAEAVISVTTSGLQTTVALGSPTGPPAPLEKTLAIR